MSDTPTITVSIPVKLGGYTGQRDQWEEHTHQCAVTLDGDSLVLESSGSFSRKFTLSRSQLEEALSIRDELDARLHDKPTPPRETPHDGFGSRPPGYDKPPGTDFRGCGNRYSHGPHVHGLNDRYYCTGRSFDAT